MCALWRLPKSELVRAARDRSRSPPPSLFFVLVSFSATRSLNKTTVISLTDGICYYLPNDRAGDATAHTQWLVYVDLAFFDFEPNESNLDDRDGRTPDRHDSVNLTRKAKHERDPIR